MRIYKGQNLIEQSHVGAKLHLTRERVRQKKVEIFDKISKFLSLINNTGFIEENPYRFIMNHVEIEINSTEGTNFSANFVRWVLSAIFDEITMIGDIFKQLTSFYHDDLFVNIVPTELCKYFDFESFVSKVETKLLEKRKDEESVNFKDFLLPFFKIKNYEEHYKDIETACISILYLNFPIKVEMGKIYFKPNFRKNNSEIIEEILRSKGHPMTLDEIYHEFVLQHPERSIVYESFRGNIGHNKNIVPIGRSSTYSLSDWDGEYYKGGSIRSIAKEYVDSLPEKIALFSKVVEFVKKYRPLTNSISIYDNLCLETTGIFQFYFRNGECYLGLGGIDYPIQYFPVVSESKTARNMSIRYPKLISFIETNGRFPFSMGILDDEKLLYKFWAKQERLVKDGNIEPHGLLYYQRIIEQYGHLKVEKKEFEWKETLKHIVEHIELLGYNSLDKPNRQWIEKNLKDYRYLKEKMPTWKMRLIEQHFLNKQSELKVEA